MFDKKSWRDLIIIFLKFLIGLMRNLKFLMFFNVPFENMDYKIWI